MPPLRLTSPAEALRKSHCEDSVWGERGEGGLGAGVAGGGHFDAKALTKNWSPGSPPSLYVTPFLWPIPSVYWMKKS